MSKITFDDLRRANLERVTHFGHGSLEEGWNPAEWGCALAGEVGELCNILKKIIRRAPHDRPVEELLVEAEKELADIQIYLDLTAAKLGVDLAKATQAKFNEVSDRLGYGIQLEAKDAQAK